MIFMMQFIKVSVLQEPPEWEVIFSFFLSPPRYHSLSADVAGSSCG